MEKTKTNKKIDLAVSFLLFGAAAIVSLIFNLKPLVEGTLCCLIPSIYLILRERKNFLKIFWAVIIFGVIFGTIFDFIETFNKAWVVTRLVFPWKIFGVLPVDDILGFMLMTLFIIVFYEHFLDDEKNPKISNNLKWALIPSLLILAFVLIVYLINPNLLEISYVYLLGGTLAIIFPIAMSLYKSRFLGKFLKLSAFFFIIWFILELVALKTEGWIFPGEYIGRVEIFGLAFPLEELFFWMMFYAATIVSYYEFFIDDKK